MILASFLPLIPTHAGIVRICEFSLLLQIPTGGLAGLVGSSSSATGKVGLVGLRAPLLCVAIALQMARILPYVPFAKKESRAAETRGHGTEFSLLIANVQQENRESGKLSQLVEQYDPDLVFLLEVDRWWENLIKTGMPLTVVGHRLNVVVAPNMRAGASVACVYVHDRSVLLGGRCGGHGRINDRSRRLGTRCLPTDGTVHARWAPAFG